jgi:uncharacterized protein (TIGR02271 family)
MDHDEHYLGLRKGLKVIGSDGEHVGSINLVEPAYIIVQKGIFPQDYYIPLSAIASHDDTTVHLTITKDEALEQGLGNPMVAYTDPGQGPEADHTSVDTADAFPANDVDAMDTASVVADMDDTVPDIGDIADKVPTNDAITADDRARDDNQHHQTIELHQEEVTATTRPVERGAIQIRKDVIEEKQTFEVPVVDDEVIVTRRRVDLDPDEGRELFTEEHIEIPLRGQEVEIETQAHVVEEIAIDKTALQHIEQITETVRHEEVRIEEADAAPSDYAEKSRPAT